MPTVHLCGGFGEKGRTSVAVEGRDAVILLDCGIKVGAAGKDYHPQLAHPVDRIAALFVTHAHEDHIGALPWLSAQGYRGPVYMTGETLVEMPETLAQYARTADLAEFRPEALDLRLIRAGQSVSVGDLHVTTGESGHVAGGLWFGVADDQSSLVYTGDIVPNSTVFPMTPVPVCDLLILDCSYGGDPVSGSERARAIAAWIAAHPGGAVLPTPLSGRSLELMAILDGPFAIGAAMREPLGRQIAQCGRPDLADRLSRARDWTTGQPLPDCPLLVHDGMGLAGPSAQALVQAGREQVPVLLSGHLPDGSPGQRLRAAGQADWLRMPTHPTLPEYRRIWELAARPPVLGHSCSPGDLRALHLAFPALDPAARTGDCVPMTERHRHATAHRQ